MSWLRFQLWRLFRFGTGSEGAAAIVAERGRQQMIEGFDRDHDSEHRDSELARAARAYLNANFYGGADAFGLLSSAPPYSWPWERKWWKPGDPTTYSGRIRNLVKAGALIAAEIDRLEVEREHARRSGH